MHWKLVLKSESNKGGVDDFRSKSLENFRLVGKDEQLVYEELDTKVAEEENPQKKTRGKKQFQKSYTCDFCVKTSTTKTSMIRHMTMHTG